jgi:hypothetical protein
MNIKSFFSILSFLFLISACKNNSEEQTGEQLAKKYCASCHLFPEPSLLDTLTWEKGVLPVMARQFGISYFGNEPYQNNVAYTNNSKIAAQSSITLSDWKKIMKYYATAAPVHLPPQERPPIRNFTDLFVVKKGAVLTDNFPALTFLKIDEGNHRIYTGSAADSSITIYND